MKNPDEIIRRTAIRTLKLLLEKTSDNDKLLQIEAVINFIENADRVDYALLVERVSFLKKISK